MTERLALLRVFDRLVERALGNTQRLGTNPDPTAIEGGHGNLEALVDLAEHGADAGTRQSSKKIWVVLEARMPSFFSLAPARRPGVSGRDQKRGDAPGFRHVWCW